MHSVSFRSTRLQMEKCAQTDLQVINEPRHSSHLNTVIIALSPSILTLNSASKTVKRPLFIYFVLPFSFLHAPCLYLLQASSSFPFFHSSLTYGDNLTLPDATMGGLEEKTLNPLFIPSSRFGFSCSLELLILQDGYDWKGQSTLTEGLYLLMHLNLLVYRNCFFPIREAFPLWFVASCIEFVLLHTWSSMETLVRVITVRLRKQNHLVMVRNVLTCLK